MKGNLIGVLIHSPVRAGVPTAGFFIVFSYLTTCGTFNYEKIAIFSKQFLPLLNPMAGKVFFLLIEICGFPTSFISPLILYFRAIKQ